MASNAVATLFLRFSHRAHGARAPASLDCGSEGGGNGLRRLADHCGRDFQGGVVLYAGPHALPLGDRSLLAVPFDFLWTR
jgi:hypothetical protein